MPGQHLRKIWKNRRPGCKIPSVRKAGKTDEELEELEDIDNLYYAIGKLSKREREIIIKRFGLFGEKELTQKEVADMMGISQSYISRLEKRILDKMRHIIEERIKVA